MFSKFVCCSALLMAAGSVLLAEPVVKNGDRIAFLGDSITAQGNYNKGGYVNLVMDALAVNNIKAVKIPAGVGGNKSNQMLARLEKDVLAKKPQIMVLSCGVNDVAAGKKGVGLEDYKKNIRSIVEKAQSAGIKVCILTATLIRENPNNKVNKNLKAYNDYLAELAKEKQCMFADVNAAMQQLLDFYRKQQPAGKGWLITYDGVHMNARGNVMLAKCVLQALGLTDEEIKKAEKIWYVKPSPVGKLRISLNDWNKLSLKAADKGMPVRDYIMYLVQQDAAGK